VRSTLKSYNAATVRLWAYHLLYVLQMSKPQTFQELASKEHDMEVTIPNYHENSFSLVELKKDRVKFRKNVKFSTSLTKEMMTISRAEPVQIMADQIQKRKEARPSRFR